MCHLFRPAFLPEAEAVLLFPAYSPAPGLQRATGLLPPHSPKTPLDFPKRASTLSPVRSCSPPSSPSADRGSNLTLKALDTLLDPKVVPNADVSVFCSEADRHLFESLEEVRDVFTYHPGRLWRSLGTLLRMARTKTDVLAAVFSGRLVYRKQKALFFLLPARSRLVFNEELDCFYLNWRNFSWLFTKSNRTPVTLFLRALRLLFFLPRFLYLVIWRR